MNLKHHAVMLTVVAGLLTGCSDASILARVQPPDQAAIAANNRAVGLMGRFEYEQAVAAFTAILEERPDWNEVKVNLAIATLNRQQSGDETRALAIAREVLQTEPANLRAHYLVGLVDLFVGAIQEALAEFEYVAQMDPQDGHAAYYLAQCLAQLSNFEQALSWYQRAMRLDPYLRSAYYGAFQSLQRLGRQQEASGLAAEYQRLDHNPRSHLAEFKYTRMGRKAEALAIDLAQLPTTPDPQGSLFAEPAIVSIETTASLQWSPPQVGSTPSLTTIDLQDDGQADLLLTGVLEVRADDGTTVTGNLVLTGQAAGGYKALLDHPLARVGDVNAALWGDFDNDGRVDVYLCRRGKNQLWRQIASDKWEDVTASTGTAGGDLDTVDGALFDADHDGDLDLFLVNADGPNELFNNNLDGTFRPLAADYGLTGSSGSSLMILPVDLDHDRDVDLIVLNRAAPHEVYLNDRLWAYHPAAGYEQFSNSAALAVQAADVDADGLAELYTVSSDGQVLRWQMGPDGEMRSEYLAAPEILQRVTQARLGTFDVDGDGSLDLIAGSARGWEVLSLAVNPVETLYSTQAAPGAPIDASMPLVNLAESGPAMLAFSAATADLTLWQPGPGRYPFITLALSGRQDGAQSMRSNASGIGAHVAVRTGSRWSMLGGYRSFSAPGQSLQPLTVGLGGARRADFVAIDWSDGVFQSEIDLPAGTLQRITETQRQLSSCPVLFAWNGEAYTFITDLLGVGGIGYAAGPGEYTTPRPWENVLLPVGSLQLIGGRYALKISEPMEENAYLDAVRLAVYDLPSDWQIVLDERMGIAGPVPTGEPRFYRDELSPVGAVNDRGDQVLDAVLAQDGVAAPVGDLDHRFIGRLQDEHILDLEFAQPLDRHPGAALLVIDGWVEYPYSQTNFAAWQAGATYTAPTLEAFSDGQWQVVLEQFGYPAGMPRRMSVPLPPLPPGTQYLRLRTNMQIYWDRISVVYAETPPAHDRHLLSLAAATVGKTGFSRRSTLDQFRPHYDYAELSPFWDTRYMAGYYTRLGPVDELLAAHDDAVVIIGPGEEVHLEFTGMAPVPAGLQRFFVLETNGWAKDMDLYTGDGETVGPLPSTGQPVAERDRLHARYNTRYQSGL